MPRFNTLDLYVVGQLARAFILTLLVIVALVVLGRSAASTGLMLNLGMSLWHFSLVTVYVLPQVLLVALTIASAVAVLSVAGRMRDSQEYFVAQAVGVGSWQVFRGAGIIALVCGLVTLSASLWLIPGAERGAERLIESYRNTPGAEFQVRAGELNRFEGGILVYPEEVSDTGELRNLYLSAPSPARGEQMFWARSAQLISDREALYLVLRSGEQISLLPDTSAETDINGEAPLVPARLAYESQQFTLVQFEPPSNALLSLESSALSLGQLLDPAFHTDEARKRELVTEAHFRLASPLLALIFPWAAMLVATAGVQSPRGGGSWRGLLVWGALILSFVLLLRVDALGDEDLDRVALFYPTALLPLGVALITRWFTRPGRRKPKGVQASGEAHV